MSSAKKDNKPTACKCKDEGEQPLASPVQEVHIQELAIQEQEQSQSQEVHLPNEDTNSCSSTSDCNFQNTQIQSISPIQPKGEKIVLTITSSMDLNRQIIKSDYATLSIPSLQQFEILPSSSLSSSINGTNRNSNLNSNNNRNGCITTIQGLFIKSANELDSSQKERLQLGDIDNFHRCRKVMHKLRLLAVGKTIKLNINGDDSNDDDDNDDIYHSDDDNCDNNTKQQDSSYQPFDIILDDPSGNSFIENPYAPKKDPFLVKTNYKRSNSQDQSLGLHPPLSTSSQLPSPPLQIREETQIDKADDKNNHTMNIITNSNNKNKNNNINIDIDIGIENHDHKNVIGKIGRDEAMIFPTICASCQKPTTSNMYITDIPHFKEVVLMSLNCDHCGYKSNEIKAGGAIPQHGTRLVLTVKKEIDLTRDVLKSDTAGIEIPELELVLDEGGLDGMYTTVEGLLDKVYTQLKEANPFAVGDSSVANDNAQIRDNNEEDHKDRRDLTEPSTVAKRYMIFLDKIDAMKKGQYLPFTIVINDPLSNSFVSPIPQQEGPSSCNTHGIYIQSGKEFIDIDGLEVIKYERSHEQNEIFGLNDMKTELYSSRF